MSDPKILQIFETLEARNDGGQKSAKTKALEQLRGIPSTKARGKGRFFVELFYDATIEAKENTLISVTIGQELLKSYLPSRYSLVVSRLILVLLDSPSIKKPTVRAANTKSIYVLNNTDKEHSMLRLF